MRLIKYVVPVIVFSVSLAAQSPGDGPRRGERGDRENGNQFEAVQEALQLTPEQIQQLQDINAAFREAAQPDREQIRALQTQLRDEFQSDNPNAAVIGQIQLDIRNIHSQVSETKSEFSQQAQAVLTPQQAAALSVLELALAAVPAARQALALNLIVSQEGGGFGPNRRSSSRRGGRRGQR